MSEGIIHCDDEIVALRQQLHDAKEENANMSLQVEKMKEVISTYETKLNNLEEEIDELLEDRIKLYTLLDKLPPENRSSEDLFHLERENRQLKEGIAKLYSTSCKEKQAYELEISRLRRQIRDGINSERSQLSERCAEYRSRIDSLQDEVNHLRSIPTLSESDIQHVKNLEEENMAQKQLITLHESLIEEYTLTVDDQQKELEVVRKQLIDLANAYDNILSEKKYEEERHQESLQQLQQQIDSIQQPSSSSMSTYEVQSASRNRETAYPEQSSSDELRNQQTTISLQTIQTIQLQSKNDALVECLPVIASTYLQQIQVYFQLSSLKSLTSKLLPHHQYKLQSAGISSTTNQLSSTTTSLDLSTLPVYISCTHYITKIGSLTEQSLQILNNPFLHPNSFNELILLLDNHLPKVYSFVQYVIACMNGEIQNNRWMKTREQSEGIDAIANFMKDKGNNGDAIWQRNHRSVIAVEQCEDIVGYVYGMRSLIHAKLEEIFSRIPTSDNIREGEEVYPSITSSSMEKVYHSHPVYQEITQSLSQLLPKLNEMAEMAELLRKRTKELRSIIQQDGFLGTPFITEDGKVMASASQTLRARTQLVCTNNSKLWDLLNTEMNAFQYSMAIVNKMISSSSSSLNALLSELSLSSPSPTTITELQKAFRNDLLNMDDNHSVKYALTKISENIKILAECDLFTSVVTNSINIPEDPTEFSPLHARAQTLRNQLETSSVIAVQQQQLEKQLETTKLTAAVLRRDLAEMTEARDLLAKQLDQHKYSLSVQMRDISGDQRALRHELEGKKNELRAKQQEIQRLRKELDGMKVKSVISNPEEVSSERYRLMKRTVQRAFADQLASQLRSLPTIPPLPSSQTTQSRQGTSPLDYIVQPAILMEASNALVLDIQSPYSSSMKEKQELAQYYSKLGSILSQTMTPTSMKLTH